MAMAKVLYDDYTFTGNPGRPLRGKELASATRYEAYLLLEDPLDNLVPPGSGGFF